MSKTLFFSVEEWRSSHPLATPYPPEWIEDRWMPLARVLDEIRLAVQRPIRVTPNGGYRNPAHNRAIGGAAKSQHLEGRAADIVVPGMAAADVHALILRLHTGGALAGLSGLGAYASFTHVDVGAGPKLRRWGQPAKRQQEP